MSSRPAANGVPSSISREQKPDRRRTAWSHLCVRQVVEQPVARKQAENRPRTNAKCLAGVFAQNFRPLEEGRESVLGKVLENADDQRDLEASTVRQPHVHCRSVFNVSKRLFQPFASFNQRSSRSLIPEASRGSTSSYDARSRRMAASSQDNSRSESRRASWSPTACLMKPSSSGRSVSVARRSTRSGRCTGPPRSEQGNPAKCRHQRHQACLIAERTSMATLSPESKRQNETRTTRRAPAGAQSFRRRAPRVSDERRPSPAACGSPVRTNSGDVTQRRLCRSLPAQSSPRESGAPFVSVSRAATKLEVLGL